MLSFLAPLFVFGLVIFVHELGHFLAAKAVGVYAPRFSIGFGPALFRFRRGETEYVLAALPLGGYVRMASRLDEESAFLEGGSEKTDPAAAPAEKPKGWDPEAMIPFGPKPVPEDRWFESKPLIARLFIMIAGVTMNAILAIVVLAVMIFQGGKNVVPTTVVGDVPIATSVPALGQLHMGDTIHSINGIAVATWNDVANRIVAERGALVFQTQRGAVTVPTLPDSTRVAIASGGLSYWVPVVVDTVVTGGRAAAAGLQAGDSIVAIDGQPMRMWSDLTKVVSVSAEKPLHFDVVRAGKAIAMTITPITTNVNVGPERKDSTTGKIGVGARDLVQHANVGVGRAIAGGAAGAWSMAGDIGTLLKQLVAGDRSVTELGGPIAITRASVSAARNGPSALFLLIALLSVNVAVLNLLPIPILDGGQILMNIIESAKGSPFSMRTREYILRVGLAAIGLILIVVMFNDTRSLFGKFFGSIFK